VCDAILFEDHGGRIGARIVMPYDLDKAAIARRALIGNDHAITGLLFCAYSAESDSNH
jgi:hypothetical protein